MESVRGPVAIVEYHRPEGQDHNAAADVVAPVGAGFFTTSLSEAR